MLRKRNGATQQALTTSTYATNTRYSVKLVKVGATLSLYINGSAVSLAAFTGAHLGTVMKSGETNTVMGLGGIGAAAPSFYGHIPIAYFIKANISASENTFLDSQLSGWWAENEFRLSFSAG